MESPKAVKHELSDEDDEPLAARAQKKVKTEKVAKKRKISDDADFDEVPKVGYGSTVDRCYSLQ